MLGNYFKIAIRQFRRQNIYSLINLLGLTLSMSCVILLFLYLRAELSFDKNHPEGDSLYRIISHARIDDDEIDTPATPFPLGPALETDKICRIKTINGVSIEYDRHFFSEDRIYKVDPSFFEMFGFKVLLGNVDHFNPDNIILIPALAQKLFGNDNPIGKTIRLNSQKMKVIAVVESPVRTHFNYNAIIINRDNNANWRDFSVYTYINTKKPASDIRSELQGIYDLYMSGIFKENNSSCRFDIQRVSGIHLNSHLRGELESNSYKINIYVYILIALFLLIIAGINYSNMATARSLQRLREIGIRKAIGSYRSELITQFLIESVMMVFFGVFLSLIIVDQVLPQLSFIGGFESFDISLFDWQLFLFVAVIVLIIGFLGGIYPAMMMSGFNASKILNNTFSDPVNRVNLRRLLVVIQLSLSIMMIICTWFIADQIKFINDKNLGYSSKNLLTISVPSDSETRIKELEKGFKQTGLVSTISTTQEVPGEIEETLGTFQIFNDQEKEKKVLAKYFSADEEFIKCFDLTLIQGGNFVSSNYALVNESFVRRLKLTNPIGAKIHVPNDSTLKVKEVQICGVVKDFHFRSLHQEIRPLVILYHKINRHLVVKLNQTRSGDLSELQSVWSGVFPEIPFDYQFVDDTVHNFYSSEIVTGKIFGIFSLVTFLLACLGLFALSYYTAEIRKKEIGIRKINGAGRRQILYLINKEYLYLVLIATIVSWPIAYLIITKWLTEFAYKIEINWMIFILTVLVVLILTLCSVSVNTIKAAKVNIVSVINHG